jgi:hypothetical protein
MPLTYNVMPFPKFFAVDENGAPYAAGTLTFYASGTTTPQDSYSDSIGTPNANPLTLDSAGRATVYLAPKAYSIVLKDSAGATIWTIDPVYGYNAFDVTGTAGEALTAGQVVYLSDGSGGQTAGRWYKADSANSYSSTLPIIGMVPASISSAAQGTIRLIGQITALAGLTAGVSYYVGTAGAFATSGLRLVGVADSTTSIVIVPNPPPPKALKPLFRQVTAVPNTFPGEITLATYTLPASTLAAAGDSVWIRAWGIAAGNGNTKTYKIHFGGTVVSTVVNAVAGNVYWEMEAEVSRITNTTQIAGGYWEGVLTGQQTLTTSPGETLSGALVIKMTGQSGTAANDITLQDICVTLVPAP